MLTTLVIGLMWITHYHLEPTIFRQILETPIAGLAHAAMLHAVPAYLDILPLYIVLLTSFPFIYLGLSKKPWLTLGVSANLQARWEIDLAWTTFGGAGRFNDINDRDFIASSVKFSF